MVKTLATSFTLATLSLAIISPIVSAQFSNQRASSTTLNTDPDVLSLENYPSPIQLLVAKDTALYASKTGIKSRKLGSLSAGAPVQLIAMTEKAYRVSAKGKYGKLKGWVSPNSVASKDPNFVENLKKLYHRQLNVNKLIANKQVAIGMTITEVNQALGEPTKKQVTLTKDGSSGTYEFIETEKQKHYRHIQDRQTGQIFRQLSHVTTVEKSNVAVDFINDVVTAIVTKDNSSAPTIETIIPPLYFRY